MKFTNYNYTIIKQKRIAYNKKGPNEQLITLNHVAAYDSTFEDHNPPLSFLSCQATFLKHFSPHY